MPQRAMHKRVSHEEENALDNARNFAGVPQFAFNSLIFRPISGHLKRKEQCVFTTIATPT